MNIPILVNLLQRSNLMGALNDTAPRSAAFTGTAMTKTVLQLSATMLLSQVAGATFGLWRGLGNASFSVTTFIDVHQELVRGLNVLLPVMGAASAILVLALAWLARRNRRAFQFYVAAFALCVAAAAITRFGNQPINAQVMEWTSQTVPANWMDIRDTWWHWHAIRTFVSIGATVSMVLAVISDRSGPSLP